MKNPTSQRRSGYRIIQSKPILVGFDKAINVMPDMTEKTIYMLGHPLLMKICADR